MKKYITLPFALLFAIVGWAQDDIKHPPAGKEGTPSGDNAAVTVNQGLKSFDAVLPNWAIDVNFKLGTLNQDIVSNDLTTAYTTNPLPPGSQIKTYSGTLKFSNGRSIGGDMSIGYYRWWRRRLGLGVGLMYMQHTGATTLDSFRFDFAAKYNATDFFRQIISGNRFSEDVTITNINIPIFLKFKYQFGNSKRQKSKYGFGITADVGPIFGIHNNTSGSAQANVDYEAIYRLNSDKSAVISGFDPTENGNSETSFIITKAANRRTTDIATAEYFRGLRANSGFNVGLNQAIAPSQATQDKSFSSMVSYGAMMQIGFTYGITYNVAFQTSGYFMYQRWRNKKEDYEPYRMFEQVVKDGDNYYSNYKPITGSLQYSDYTAYGVSAGLRFFFGEKRDIDGDGWPDDDDNCDREFGTLHGCPDSDNDGVPDGSDDCPSDAQGPYGVRGCPDRDGDGVLDKNDECKDVPGDMKNGCLLSDEIAKRQVVVDSLPKENGSIMEAHILLETDVLHFAFGSSQIADSVAEVLDYAANLLQKKDGIVIYISGYTDDIGSARSNLVLSYNRAKAAKAYLVGKGIDSERVIIGAYGKEYPVDKNNSPEARAKNRRIEMKLLVPVK